MGGRHTRCLSDWSSDVCSSDLIAGTRAHGFVQHWKNLVPHAPLWLYPLLIPLELIGMLVRPFALTMRLAANMTGGHIAILAILSFVRSEERRVGKECRDGWTAYEMPK